MDVEAWLRNLGFENYAQNFAANGVDASLLPRLTSEDLRDLGIARLADRKQILAAISALASSSAAQGDTSSRTTTLQMRRVERRQLTVMFVDMVGSTQLSYRMDPEDLRDVLVRYQDTVTDAVERYGGYVARYAGDGVLAYFGWPHAHEDQAERAVRSGLACIDAISQLTDDNGQPLRSRVGIATGRVVVGEITVESDAVVGETPNLAARLQSLAKPNQVIIEQTTRRLIGEAYELTDLGPHRLKGIPNPVPSWCVVAKRSLDSRFKAAHAGGLTPFVGRQEELGLILERWSRARAGHGQVVLLSGEAGIGKSRIVSELREAIASDMPESLHFQCSPLHSSSAFYPVIQHIERAAAFLSEESPELKLDKLESLLADLGADMNNDAPLLAALMDLPWKKRYQLVDTYSRQLKQRTLSALTAYILSDSRPTPTILVFEDAHWIDPSSRELLEKLVDQLESLPALLLVTCRSDVSMDKNRYSHITSLTLGRLDRSQAANVVLAAGGSELKDDAVARITERTDGIPLFLEELTRSVIESGTQISDTDIPITLQASLAERLDRLNEARDVAAVGSVIGRDFAYSVLAKLLEMPENELERRLDRLIASGLVFGSGSPPNSVYTFKHSLVQETAYSGLLKKQRRQFHILIGTVLEEHFPDTVRAEPELLAHHFEFGQELAKALGYWIEAGDRAGSIPAPTEARSHYWRALEVVQRMPECSETRRLLMRTVISLMRVSYDIGGSIWRSEQEQRKALSLIEAAIEIAAEVGDAAALAILEADQASRLHDEKLYDRALARAESIGESVLQANIAFRYSGFLGRSGKYESSQNHSRVAIELYGKIGDDIQKALAMAGAARCYTARAGNIVESLRYADEARKIAETTGDPQIKSWLAMEAEPYLYKGIWRNAVRAVEEHLPAAWQIGNWQVILFASAWATIANIKLARLDKAKSLIEKALSGADERVGYNFPRTWARLALSQLHVELGNLEDAHAAADWAHNSAVSHSHHLEHGAALRVLGRIHEKDGDIQRADRHYRRSLDIFGTIQSRPELAQSMLAYGRFNLKHDRKEGLRLLELALKQFQKMDATGWIDETRKVLQT